MRPPRVQKKYEEDNDPILPNRSRLPSKLVLESRRGRSRIREFPLAPSPDRSRVTLPRVHHEIRVHAVRTRPRHPDQLQHEELVDVAGRVHAREHDVARIAVEVLD